MIGSKKRRMKTGKKAVAVAPEAFLTADDRYPIPELSRILEVHGRQCL